MTVSVSFLSSQGPPPFGTQVPRDHGSLMGIRKLVTLLTAWFVSCQVGTRSLSAFWIRSRRRSWTRLPWGLSRHPPAPSRQQVGEGCVLGPSSFLSLTAKGPSVRAGGSSRPYLAFLQVILFFVDSSDAVK